MTKFVSGCEPETYCIKVTLNWNLIESPSTYFARFYGKIFKCEYFVTKKFFLNFIEENSHNFVSMWQKLLIPNQPFVIFSYDHDEKDQEKFLYSLFFSKIE